MVRVKWKIALKKGPDGFYTATVPSLPGCISQGRTKAKALTNIKEAIGLHVQALARSGVPLSSRTEVASVAVRI